MDYINKIARLPGVPADMIDWLILERPETFDVAWANCYRGDWMLWIAGYFADDVGSDSRKKLALAAASCAALALRYSSGDAFARPTIITVRDWLDGKATLHDVKRARDEAHVASESGASPTWGAWAAAAVAVDQCGRREIAWTAQAAAANAANAAAWAAGPNAADVVESRKILSLCADTVRRTYITPPSLDVN
jgi:hypothetical protein